MDNREQNELSLPDCRRLLGAAGDHLSDDDLRSLRTGMYELARCVVDAFPRHSNDTQTRALAIVPENDREDLEERAAVLEFDANMTRDAATRAAVTAYARTAACPRRAR